MGIPSLRQRWENDNRKGMPYCLKSAKTLTALSAIRSILFIIKKITSSNQISGWNNENVNQIRYYTSDHPNVIVVINRLLEFAHSTTHINFSLHIMLYSHTTHMFNNFNLPSNGRIERSSLCSLRLTNRFLFITITV
jgi:hypothetical protein